ncbi:transcription factor Sp4 [Lates japonicus]|uniref:Transcription factor Sp4 n=1 Tax=Lates japonicus TaxID=270547 RepID=A0AAD3RLF4_LATJO|nr:transcription factor Sp4 [Lates japonicus]
MVCHPVKGADRAAKPTDGGQSYVLRYFRYLGRQLCLRLAPPFLAGGWFRQTGRSATAQRRTYRPSSASVPTREGHLELKEESIKKGKSSGSQGQIVVGAAGGQAWCPSSWNGPSSSSGSGLADHYRRSVAKENTNQPVAVTVATTLANDQLTWWAARLQMDSRSISARLRAASIGELCGRRFSLIRPEPSQKPGPSSSQPTAGHHNSTTNQAVPLRFAQRSLSRCSYELQTPRLCMTTVPANLSLQDQRVDQLTPKYRAVRQTPQSQNQASRLQNQTDTAGTIQQVIVGQVGHQLVQQISCSPKLRVKITWQACSCRWESPCRGGLGDNCATAAQHWPQWLVGRQWGVGWSQRAIRLVNESGPAGLHLKFFRPGRTHTPSKASACRLLLSNCRDGGSDHLSKHIKTHQNKKEVEPVLNHTTDDMEEDTPRPGRLPQIVAIGSPLP